VAVGETLVVLRTDSQVALVLPVAGLGVRSSLGPSAVAAVAGLARVAFVVNEAAPKDTEVCHMGHLGHDTGRTSGLKRAHTRGFRASLVRSRQ